MRKLIFLVLVMVILIICCGEDSSPIIEPASTTAPVGSMVPPNPKLTLIIDQPNSLRQLFTAIKFDSGVLVGDYGLNVGGPTVNVWDGKNFILDSTFTECESVFDLYMPEDGLPILTNEYYGKIRKRLGPGVWETKYSRPYERDLMFYILRAGDNLYANWLSFDKPRGGVVRGDLNGNNWSEVSSYTNKALPGMCSDGSNIYLAGQTDQWYNTGYPILTDIGGSIISRRMDKPGFRYWGVCKFNNIFILGTIDDSPFPGIPPHSVQIDVFDGTTNTTVWSNERSSIYKIEEHKGKVYTVVTWDWYASPDKTSLLMVSSDGYKWDVLAEIPCPSIIGMKIYDDGIYLSGGKFQTFGKMFFYKL